MEVCWGPAPQLLEGASWQSRGEHGQDGQGRGCGGALVTGVRHLVLHPPVLPN